MVGVAAGAAIAGIGAYMSGEAQKDAARSQANAQVRAAELQAQQQRELAEKQRQQAEQLQQEQQAFEAARQKQLAEQQAAMAASAKQAATDQALSAQNQQVSDLTPTVQIASEGTGENSASKARARRAQFRPEYGSGISI